MIKLRGIVAVVHVVSKIQTAYNKKGNPAKIPLLRGGFFTAKMLENAIIARSVFEETVALLQKNVEKLPEAML